MRLLLFTCLFFAFCQIDAQVISGGPLGDLFMAREGGLVQYSSADPTGGNSDRRPIAPGESLTLMEHEGAGVVRRWWITIAPRNSVEIHRSLIVRCFWDGEEEPSVEVPVADFFGMGFGEWKDYISFPLNMTSGGYNTYWPMPFRESARIEVVNTGSVPINSFYYNIDVRTYESLPDEALYFHAQFRMTTSREEIPITILETTGRGHYVGTLISMQPTRGSQLGYLEGDEMIYIDGERTPSIIGTGTEDYFSSGWYYITGEYSAPYHGITIKDEEKGRVNTYRWHIEDPIPFTESLKFDIEHGGTNDFPDVEYASVAFWYQTHPHPAFPDLPEDMMPRSSMSGPSIEGEDLLDVATVTGGRLETQGMSNFQDEWSNDSQLWWLDGKPGDRLTLPIQVEESGTYEIIFFFTEARDYGIVKLSVDGEDTGHFFDGFNNKVSNSGPISFGKTELKKGTNELVITLVGKDARSNGTSKGYLVGVDGILLYK